MSDLVDIKGPLPDGRGYGTYSKPGVHITKGQWLEEYIGELKPLSSVEEGSSSGRYCIWIPGTCIVDSEEAGNWTRFINSHCRPNVKSWGDFIGKRHVVLIQALRDIGPEEELVLNYGRSYFEHAEMECRCDAYKKTHLPGAETAKKPRRR